MNDKELLEYAAKAVGIEITYHPDGVCRDVTGLHPLQNIFSAKTWAPLTDDGDALRLAVKLELHVLVGMAQDGDGRIVVEKEIDDPYSATRRAIVRAAAEIGKAMK